MLVLGINGSLALVNENKFNVPYGEFHDSAAVLIENGKIVAAFEEERLNRIKHSNKRPLLAIQACLERRNITIDQVDRYAIPWEEDHFDSLLAEYRRMDPGFSYVSARQFLRDTFYQYFHQKVDLMKFVFINHHLAHAASGYYVSGFDRSLILTIDGKGDNLSGGVYEAEGNIIHHLRTFSAEDSLGHLYLEVTRLLGFSPFDEYKVMGLAPYGDSTRFSAVFERTYTLLPGGNYKIDWSMAKNLRHYLPSRSKNETLTQAHKDVASAVQKAIETIVFHMLNHYRSAGFTGNLCLAGGVALNCTMTGKLRYARLFEHIFVQPASHDGGIPMGAALAVYYQSHPKAPRYRMEHAYYGSNCPDTGICMEKAGIWKDFLSASTSRDICREAAKLIAEGHVIGWFQGASEYGPRALGNRSILADPRPTENKDRINIKIKGREGFRPFAPSILEDKAAEYFELPDEEIQYPYMTFILRVKEKYRALLGATTHTDGTARVQTVARDINPRYYRLIEYFGELTGTPVVLNTSFNNNVEPIVDTPEEAIVCYLTTGLDYLIIGDLVIRKKEYSDLLLLALYPVLPQYVRLYTVHSSSTSNFIAGNTYNDTKYSLSYQLYTALENCDGSRNFLSLLTEEQHDDPVDPKQFIDEIKRLWYLRIIRLSPVRTMEPAISACQA